jgi:hypothetical protein
MFGFESVPGNSLAEVVDAPRTADDAAPSVMSVAASSPPNS